MNQACAVNPGKSWSFQTKTGHTLFLKCPGPLACSLNKNMSVLLVYILSSLFTFFPFAQIGIYLALAPDN